ncbi:MAG TPA: hypothetical protein VGB83_01840 [Actinomycetota bacterium]
MNTVKLAVPARTEYIPVVRSMIAGLGALADLSIDKVDDLRLATTEACGYLLAIAPGARILHAAVDSAPATVRIVARVDDGANGVRSVEPGPALTWPLLRALTDRARLEWTTAGPAIHLRLGSAR